MTMAAALLWVDALLNLLMGALLAGFPKSVIAWLGLPLARPEFYARVLGAVLVGIGLALLVELWQPSAGIGLPGAVVINLCGAAMLAALLVAGLEVSRRGQIVLWCLVAMLLCLSGAEFAFAQPA